MSHATVMVLGPRNEEELADVLAPFDENLETEPRIVPCDEWTMSHRQEGETLEAFAKRQGDEWCQTFVVKGDELFEETTFNENAKWDWWVIGGRWRGSLPLKDTVGDIGVLGEPGVFGSAEDRMYPKGVDAACLGDISFASVRESAGAAAANRWDKAQAARAGRTLPPYPDLDGVEAELGRDLMKAWHDHPVIADIKNAVGWEYFFGFEDMVASRENYIDDAIASAAPCFATLVPGEGWLEPGRMGWFGMDSSDRDSRAQYNNRVNELLNTLPDETMVWVVDFHI